MSLPNVGFAVKTTSVTPHSITGRYQCTTQVDRDVGYREWFKTVPAIYHEISMLPQPACEAAEAPGQRLCLLNCLLLTVYNAKIAMASGASLQPHWRTTQRFPDS